MALEEVAGGLGSPCAGGVGSDASEEHFSGGDVDEEQQVVAAQEWGVDACEVACNGCLGAQELGPGHRAALWRGVDAVVFEDSPDCGGPDLVAEVGEFAVDAAVAPGRIVCGHSDDEPSDLGGGGWPAW